MIRDKEILFISTYGHCGIDWIHSLLHSHSQILIPPALSFFRTWKMLKSKNAKNPEEIFNTWKNYITLSVGYESQNIQKKIFYSIEEQNSFFDNFSISLKTNGGSLQSIFWSFYESYAIAKEIDLTEIKLLVIHEHLPWPLDFIQSEFPKSKFLLMMRDPRAAIAGIIKGRIDDFGYLPDFTFNMIFETWFQAHDFKNKYANSLSGNLRILKNEDLHCSLEASMRNLASWLNIDFNKSLLIPTNHYGVITRPDSRYLNKNQTIENDFYHPKKVKERWLSVLSENEIIMIECLLSDVMKEFNYVNLNKKNFVKQIKATLFFLIPNRSLFSKWKAEYPYIEDFKKISAKLSLINFRIGKIWNMLPKSLKFFLIFTASTIRRVKILYFPGKRWKRYDNSLKDL